MKPRLNQREYSGHVGSKMAEKGFICVVHICKDYFHAQCAFYQLELILTKELTDTLCENKSRLPLDGATTGGSGGIIILSTGNGY
uniref:Uncharacterized protein n=1 Tax=Magallana gigas TaxID=29159 RepID=K1RER1_MAGGI